MTSDADRTRAFLWVWLAYLAAIVVALLVGIALGGQPPIVVALAADLAATFVVFGFGFAFDNASFYDPYWSVAPPVIGLYFVAGAPGGALPVRQALVFALVALWALRLTWNWARGWSGLGHEDWRYVDMRQSSGGLYWPGASLFGIHLFPTVVVFLGCLPALARPRIGRAAARSPRRARRRLRPRRRRPRALRRQPAAPLPAGGPAARLDPRERPLGVVAPSELPGRDPLLDRPRALRRRRGRLRLVGAGSAPSRWSRCSASRACR